MAAEFTDGVYNVQATGTQFIKETPNGHLIWNVLASPIEYIDDDGEVHELGPDESSATVYVSAFLSKKSLEKFVPAVCKELGIKFSSDFADETIEPGHTFRAECKINDAGYDNWDFRLGTPKAGTSQLTVDAKAKLKELFGASEQQVPEEFTEV